MFTRSLEINTIDTEGTLVRVDLSIPNGQTPRVTSETVIARGFAERTDPSALVVVPTGVGVSADGGTIFVADTVNSRIVSVPSTGGSPRLVSAGSSLNGPLGLAMARNGDILTVNGGDGKLLETAPTGPTVATKVLDTLPPKHGPEAGAGTLFGLAVAPQGSGVYFVDDGTNTLKLLH